MHPVPPDRYVVSLDEVDRTHVPLVGGKAANLGELSRIDGIRVPAGFCVTAEAFRRVRDAAPSMDDQLARLSRLGAEDRESIRLLSGSLRDAFEATAIPDDVSTAIAHAVTRLGQAACAVRSSATAEDLPSASFAGQHDTYLHIAGPEAVLEHVKRCWASLFTERAVTYRLRNAIDQWEVEMAVIVQQMVDADAGGTMFTADPVTSNRRIVSIEATFGLGDALVSGTVNADVYKVRDGEIVSRAIAAHSAQEQPVLTDAQAVRLAETGRRIEAHFGRPQDIEWCLNADGFHIVQSRPITTLFPVPAADDGENHVYISVGHQQMMTDPMTPLGLSVFQLTALRPMFEAAGRLFVDVTRELASPSVRAGLLALVGRSDPLITDALQTILDRGDFIPSLPDDAPTGPRPGGPPSPIETDPALVTELIERTKASVAALERDIQGRTGEALLDFIREDIEELKRILTDPQSHQVVMAGMEAMWWLNDQLFAWLGEKNAADTLSQSVPNNVTSEMGLALLDVADAIRPHPDVVAFLDSVADDGFLDELPKLDGGQEARDAILAYLDLYGMRCVGEIDITRPRWSERPSTLVPLILAHVRNDEPGARERRFEQGRKEAADKERELLERLRALPDGEQKAEETKRMIERARTFVGYREFPKYGIVSRYFVYKRALLAEAECLVQSGVLREPDDAFFLTFQELHDVVRTHEVDHELIDRRREELRQHQTLVPPRVLTSDGEAVAGAYRRDGLPPGALVGLPVSAGTIEGRARVIHDLAEADVEPGDILVTTYTDPSWSPLFVAVRGLVTEVGGLMTHGAVIAREYGLPAVVGVENATRLIPDGRRLRVDGIHGSVELL